MIELRRRWVLWLLAAGAPAVVLLWLTTTNALLRLFYPFVAVLLLATLGLLLVNRITEVLAGRVLLLVGVGFAVLALWTLLQRDVTPLEGGYYVFRTLAPVMGVAFVALGPRVGTLAGLVLLAATVPVLVALGLPLVGGDDLSPSVLFTLLLLLTLLALFRILAATAERFEQTAEDASDNARLAFVDELTGLPNRRQLDVHLRAAAARLAEGGKPDGLIMFDLDHFKAINDTHGHEAGDEVLRRAAAIAAAAIREHDVVGRWGGEEFLALLDRADLEQAIQIAERCRRAFESVGGRTAVTASFGVTILDVDDDVEMALRRVDEALYEAKQAGRNTVVWRSRRRRAHEQG